MLDAAREVLDARARRRASTTSKLRGADLGPRPERGDARLLVAAKVGTTRLIDNVAVTLGAVPRRTPNHRRPSAADEPFTLEEATNMFRTMMKSKIHRATVTHADLHYVGSVTVDQDLMDAADLLEGEQVCIVDIDNGARLETYVIAGERGTASSGSTARPRIWSTRATWSSSSPTALMDEQEVARLRAAGRVRRRPQPPIELGSDPAHAPEGSGLITPRIAVDARRLARLQPVSRCCSTVDVRNTNIVLGLFSGSGEHGNWCGDWRMRTDPRMTADELALTVRGLLGAHARRGHRRLRAVDGAAGAARAARDAGAVLAATSRT